MKVTSLMLRSLPMWNCCEHCKDAYCPKHEGHYVRCLIRDCIAGNNLKGT